MSFLKLTGGTSRYETFLNGTRDLLSLFVTLLDKTHRVYIFLLIEARYI
jgi:hypothetical protein